VNSNPVVGLLVRPHPAQLIAASSIVSAVAVVGQPAPPEIFCTPPTHSESMVGESRTVPVRSTPDGWRIVWSARTVMSKPLRGAEFWMNTATRS
jgi:hypothetical protein